MCKNQQTVTGKRELTINLLELPTNICNVARKVRESWDNRMTFPPTEVPERYVRGDLSILVELSFEFRGKRSACSVQVAFKLDGEARGEFDGWHRAEQEQFSVLVLNIEVMHDPERIVLYFSVVLGRFVFVLLPRI